MGDTSQVYLQQIAEGTARLAVDATSDDASTNRVSAISDDAGLMRVSALGMNITDVTNTDAADFRVSTFVDDAAQLRVSTIQEDARFLRVSSLSEDASLMRVSALGLNIADISNSDAADFRVSTFQQDANYLHTSTYSEDATLFRVSAFSDDAAKTRISSVQKDAGVLRISAVQSEPYSLNVVTNTSKDSKMVNESVYSLSKSDGVSNGTSASLYVVTPSGYRTTIWGSVALKAAGFWHIYEYPSVSTVSTAEQLNAMNLNRFNSDMTPTTTFYNPSISTISTANEIASGAFLASNPVNLFGSEGAIYGNVNMILSADAGYLITIYNDSAAAAPCSFNLAFYTQET